MCPIDSKTVDLCARESHRPLKSCFFRGVRRSSASMEGAELRREGKKSVHFADSKGLSLVRVFEFHNTYCETEKSPQKVAQTLNMKRSDEKVSLLNFNQPVCRPDFASRVDNENVCLENVVFRAFGIFGTIRVKNVAFHKTVLVRYTFDSWASHNDLTAQFVPGSNTGTTDTFSFELAAPSLNDKDKRMEFAIRYETGGQTFWDNNYGDNYRVIFRRTSSCLEEEVEKTMSTLNINYLFQTQVLGFL